MLVQFLVENLSSRKCDVVKSYYFYDCTKAVMQLIFIFDFSKAMMQWWAMLFLELTIQWIIYTYCMSLLIINHGQCSAIQTTPIIAISLPQHCDWWRSDCHLRMSANEMLRWLNNNNYYCIMIMICLFSSFLQALQWSQTLQTWGVCRCVFARVSSYFLEKFVWGGRKEVWQNSKLY